MRKLAIAFFLSIFFNSVAQNIKELPPSFDSLRSSEEMRLFVKLNSDHLHHVEERGVLELILNGPDYQLISTNSEGLDKLVKSGEMQYISTPSRGMPLNNLMITNNNVLPIHQGIAPLNSELGGEGVIMGIIDTGIELLHPDFLNEDGTTRILELWDHTFEYDEEHIPQPYGFGTRWTQEEINEGVAIHQDQAIWFGHGSTVTGTACGNGSAVGDFKGVAPKSDMVIVSFDFSTPSFLEDVAQAVQYIYEVADEAGKPCVINMSLGTYYGSHDGFDATALLINEMLEEPGRLMTAAVGNSNTVDPYHLGVDIVDDTVFTWFEYENNLDIGGSGVFFELWADTNEMAELNFSMGADKSDFPYSTRGVTEPISYMDCLGSTVSREIRNDSDDLLAIAQFWSQYRGEQVQMQVSIIDPDSSEFNFRFQAMGSGSYDIWSTSVFGTSDIINGEDIPEVSEFPEIAMYRAPDKRMNMVSSWTCSDKVITVANYMNRVSYIDYTGELATVPGIDGEINESSSSGPTRDGRQKPDIAATGSVTLSTGNFPMLDYLIQNEPFKVAQGGMHFRNGGSSMASPVLAGIAALYLEQCPNTTWESFRNAVINTAAIDEFATEAPDRYWGHGKVNAFGVVAFDAIELDIQQSGSELMASGGDSYQWYLDSEVLEGETGSTLTIIGPGLYIVEAFNQAGCAVFSEPFLVTDLNSYSKPVFKIWPNPVKDLLRFEGLENSQGIVITDSYGAKILSLDYRPNLAIDVSRFSSGLYFVEVRAEDSMQIKKLIIE